MPSSSMPGADATHWYCHVVFDVVDPHAFRSYLQNQVAIEQTNGMMSYEFFVNDEEKPTEAVLIECFPDDDVQQAHLENLRGDLFLAGLGNPRISVYGNPPASTRQRMLDHGFWPPAFEGEFQHFVHFAGFR